MTRTRSKSFFDLYPEEYDLLTDASQREVKHDAEVAVLIDRFQPASVLDAGCGTGLTTYLFARRQVRTVGMDRAKAMLDIARKKYAGLGMSLEFVYGDFQRLPKRLGNKFDLVVCLANAIVGVETEQGLQRALKEFAVALTSNGFLVLQLLNYRSLKDGVVRSVKVTQAEGKIYQRFIERQDKSVHLYISRFDSTQQPPQSQLFVSAFRSFEPPLVKTLLGKTGFSHVELFGDLLLQRRFSSKSNDLVIVARKSR